MTTACAHCGSIESHQHWCPIHTTRAESIADFNAQQQGLLASRTALNKQVAGDHYKQLKIQPIEYIHANNLPFAEGSVIKYVSRWRAKGGIKDLEKAKHFIELLIELESRA